MKKLAVTGSKLITRNTILPLIILTGTEKLLSRFSKNDYLILMYHGILPTKENIYHGRHFYDKIFEKQLIYFKKNFNVVRLSEIFKMYQTGYQSQKKTIAITFDDGYLNNYRFGFPLLKKYEIPATFFVATAGLYNERAILWPDLISMLRQHIKGGILYEKYRFDPILPFDLYDKQHKLSITEYIKYLGVNEREVLLNWLTKKYNFQNLQLQIDENQWKLVNRNQIIELSKSGLIEIGSHSVSHFNLANIDKKNAEIEITQSKEILENILQKEIESFAFPDGNYDDFVKNTCCNAGYKYLTAIKYKLETDQNDPYILPRYSVGTTTDHNSKIVFIHKAFHEAGFKSLNHI